MGIQKNAGISHIFFPGAFREIFNPVGSQLKAHGATEAGKFKNEIIPISYTDKDGNLETLDRDTHIKPNTSAEKINGLPRPFKRSIRHHDN